MKFKGLLAFLFAFCAFYADDPNGGGGDPDPKDPPQDPPQDPPKDDPKKPDDSDLRAELEKERLARKALEDKIAAREREEAEKKGEWEKLYKTEKEQWQAKETQFKLSQAMNTFKAEAIKQGCQNPDDLAQLLQKDIRKLQVDPATFQVDASEVSGLISQAKESKSYLFNKPAPKTDDLPPGKASMESYTEAIRKCKTQKEFDEVRKKFGRI